MTQAEILDELKKIKNELDTVHADDTGCADCYGCCGCCHNTIVQHEDLQKRLDKIIEQLGN